MELLRELGRLWKELDDATKQKYADCLPAAKRYATVQGVGGEAARGGRSQGHPRRPRPAEIKLDGVPLAPTGGWTVGTCSTPSPRASRVAVTTPSSRSVGRPRRLLQPARANPNGCAMYDSQRRRLQPRRADPRPEPAVCPTWPASARELRPVGARRPPDHCRRPGPRAWQFSVVLPIASSMYLALTSISSTASKPISLEIFSTFIDFTRKALVYHNALCIAWF